jgi:hypothetical protein
MKGIPQMKQKVDDVRQRLPIRVALALLAEAEIEIEESKRRVPVDTGALKKSAYVGAPVQSGTKTSIELGYDMPYAIYVHEDLEAFHPVGEAKYLESVLNESARHMKDRLAARLHLDR